MGGEDPASMRHVAQRLRALAGEVEGHTQRVAAAARSVGFEGPAGDAFRQVVAQSAAGVSAQTQGLAHLAARLESAAADIEWQRRLAQQQGGF